MQDWEWEVADPERIDEFLAAYEIGSLTEDERFTLMETIIQSFEDLDDSFHADSRWERVLEILEGNVELHIYSIWYWADLENDCTWRVTPSLRTILQRHRKEFARDDKATN